MLKIQRTSLFKGLGNVQVMYEVWKRRRPVLSALGKFFELGNIWILNVTLIRFLTFFQEFL